jgi:hypothetical protein
MARVSKINGISIPNTSITGFTYDDVNTFTINQNDGVSFSASINILSATTFYGDGSNLTGVGGSFTSFDISDGNNTQTINDGNTISFLTNSGLTFTVSATDNVTLDYNLTGMTSVGTPTTGDKMLIWDADVQQHRIFDWSDLPGAAGGETNTASNIGVGFGVFKQKSGVDFQFRSLSAGTNITITTGDTIVINSSGGGGSSRTESSVTTTNATATELEKIDTLVDNANNVVEVYVTAYETGGTEYGTWKRTLTVTKTSGTVTIRRENADVDESSSGLNANSIDFTVNGGAIDLDVTGIASTTINWKSVYEIII